MRRVAYGISATLTSFANLSARVLVELITKGASDFFALQNSAKKMRYN
jgi:hypothetical protein